MYERIIERLEDLENNQIKIMKKLEIKEDDMDDDDFDMGDDLNSNTEDVFAD
jgi:hypothetical protein